LFYLVVVPAGALGQLLDDCGPEVAAHDEVDDRVQDGVDERQQEEAHAGPDREKQLLAFAKFLFLVLKLKIV
jgi:hypothetical protein